MREETIEEAYLAMFDTSDYKKEEESLTNNYLTEKLIDFYIPLT